MTRRAALLLAAAVTLPAGLALAQAPAPNRAASRAALTVTVHSGAGAAVAGAEVVLEPDLPKPPAGSSAARSPEPPPKTLTGADGVATLEGVSPGRAVVSVTAKGYAPKRLTGVLIPAGTKQSLAVDLSRAFLLEGRVTDPEGKPVPKAEVCLTRPAGMGDADEADADDGGETPGSSGVNGARARQAGSGAAAAGNAARAPEPGSGAALPGDERKPPQRCARAAEDGSVKVQAVPEGPWQVMVRASGFSPLGRALTLREPVPKQSWRLSPGGGITGRVVDPGGVPLPAAVVRAWDTRRAGSDAGQTPQARTDAEGKFTLRSLPAGTLRVEVEPEEFDHIVVAGVVVKPGADTPLGDLKARPGAPLEGRVLGTGGEAVSGATVRVHQQGQNARLLRRVKTDAAGTFRVGGLPPETKVDLVVVPPKGFVPRREENVSVPRKDLELRLEPAGSISGTLRLAEGVTIPPRLVLTARSETELESVEKTATSREADPLSARFRIENVLPSEKVTVVARGGGFWSDPVVVAVEPGREAGPIELELKRGSRASGSVHDATGAPVAGAQITIEGEEGAISGAAGEFVLDGVAPGAREIRAVHPEFAPATRRQAFPLADGERIDLRLDRGGTISGTVTDSDEAPVAGIPIALDTEDPAAVTDAAGRYEFPHVAAGPMRVRRMGSGARDDFEVRSVEVVEGRTVTVDFRLGNVLAGQLRRSGLPVAGAFVSLARPATWADEGRRTGQSFAAQTAYSDAAGEFRLTGPTAGWATLTVIDGSQEIQKLVDIPTGREPRLEVDLPDKPVRGRVLVESTGKPVPGSRVFGSMPSPAGAPHSDSATKMVMGNEEGEQVAVAIATEYRIQSQADGNGEFLLLLEGQDRTQVSAWAAGYSLASAEARPGQPEPVVLRMGRSGKLVVKVTDTAGRPVGQKEVCLLIKTEGEHGMQTCEGTNADATELDVREGKYVLTVSSPGFASQVLAREANFESGPLREELTVKLSPGARLSLRLPGAGAETARVRSLIGPGDAESASLVEDGGIDPATGDHRWHAAGLEPGEWTVVIALSDGKTLKKTITVTPPETEAMLP